MNASILTDVHRYWFGDPDRPAPPAELFQRWFRPTPEIDAHIEKTYGRHLEPARAAVWDIGAMSREQQAGLIVLLDQFPRQIYREDPRAFAYDAKAKEIAARLVADGGWRRFSPFERAFVMLPFEHSESVADQDTAVLLFASPTVGLVFALKAFAIIVMAGLGNLTGVLWASVVLGVSEALVQTYVPSGGGWSDAVFFLMIFLTLVWRSFRGAR